MGWERGYYYRVRKVNGRVVREYVGTGRVAHLAAHLDALDREKREAERAAWREERAQLDALDAGVAALIRLTDLAAAAALLAAGFHQHKRQWRRKRHGNASRANGPDRPEGAGEGLAARPPRG
jgi:hypothetical protein